MIVIGLWRKHTYVGENLQRRTNDNFTYTWSFTQSCKEIKTQRKQLRVLCEKPLRTLREILSFLIKHLHVLVGAFLQQAGIESN
jgi:hypothetical protein